MKNKNKVCLFALLLGVGFFVVSENSFASEVIVEWNFPSDKADVKADNGIDNNSDKPISVEGVGAISFTNSDKSTKAASATMWSGDNCEKYWQIEFNSLGYKNLTISSSQRSSDTGPRDFIVQYKIGEDGDWMGIDRGNILVKNNFTSGVLDNLILPGDCDDQELVYIRWIKSSDWAVNNLNIKSTGTNSIDDIVIKGELINFEDEETGEDVDLGESGDEEVECVRNSSDVKINEIFPAPENDENEFVEFINLGEGCIDLSGWKITDDANHKYIFPENTVVESGNFIYVKQKLYLNNDTDTVFLYDAPTEEGKDGILVDKIKYGEGQKNFSYSFDGENWRWTSISTPGEENEFEEIEEDEGEKYEGGNYAIRLNEILPNPKGNEEKEEYIEIYNGEGFAMNLKDWILKDSSKNGKFVFPKDYDIKSGEYLTIYRDDFKFSLNNSGQESVYLLDPDKNIISAVSYEGAKENISYNFDGAKWSWSKHLTPGKENKFNSTPKVKVKKIKTGYVGMPVYFESDVKSKDDDGLKFTWNFDDGGKSYLQNVNHAFKKEGKYKIKLTVDDGATGIEKSFTINIKKYPKASIEITRLLPNPKGNDTGEEWLEVKNNSSKKINLKGWKIATGTKNLTNHSITDNLEIPAGEAFQITRENSLFFLNNKEATVELRYPNGKTATKISYKKDKIEEGEICVNKGGVCGWILTKDEEENKDEENGDENGGKSNAPEDNGGTFGNFDSELSKINFSKEFLKENLGKLSKEENDLLKEIYEIRLVKNGSENSLVVDLKNGKGFVHQLSDSYQFTPSLSQTHWAVDFLEDMKVKILSSN